MSQPEIFRRCLECGASFHSGAAYCPQCGVATDRARANAASTSEGESDGGEGDSISTKSEEPREHSSRHSTGWLEKDVQPVGANAVTQRIGAPNINANAAAPAPVPAQSTAATTKLDRGLRPGETRRHRTIVIDESAYDPSLRFVIVAGVLFALFLFILIMSKWIS